MLQVVVQGLAVGCFCHGLATDGVPKVRVYTTVDSLLDPEVPDRDSHAETGFPIAKEPIGPDEELDVERDSFHNA